MDWYNVEETSSPSSKQIALSDSVHLCRSLQNLWLLAKYFLTGWLMSSFKISIFLVHIGSIFWAKSHCLWKKSKYFLLQNCFIGPQSDQCLALSLTNYLKHIVWSRNQSGKQNLAHHRKQQNVSRYLRLIPTCIAFTICITCYRQKSIILPLKLVLEKKHTK